MENPAASQSQNWNVGTRPTIRTSLGRSALGSEAASKELTPLLGEEPPAPVETASALEGGQAGERYGVGAEAPATQSHRDPPAQGDEDEIDDENDSLYGESGDVRLTDHQSQPSASEVPRPGAVGASPSDDDSDILQLHTDEELDHVLMINVSEPQEQLPGTDANARPNGDHTASRHQKVSTSPDEGEIRSESPADDMMRYADANAASAWKPSPAPENNSLAYQTSKPESISTEYQPPEPTLLTLGDLTTAELELQVRYFYVGRSPSTIPLSDSARCLVCMGVGHASFSCNRTTCTRCSSQQHFFSTCPELIPCPRCRQTGHSEHQCRSKLRALAEEQRATPCALCHRLGHNEYECEVLWRSAPYPWTADLPVSGFRPECFECGRSGHLGNDCPTRQPNKPLGTTSWSMRACTAPPRGPIRPVGVAARSLGRAAPQRSQFHYRGPPPAPARGGRSRSRSPSGRSRGGERARSHSPPDPHAFTRHNQLHSSTTERKRGGGIKARGRGIQIRHVAGRDLPPPSAPVGPTAQAARSKPANTAAGKGSKRGKKKAGKAAQVAPKAGRGGAQKRGDKG